MRLIWNRSDERRRRSRPVEKYTQSLVANHRRKVPRGTLGRKWEDNIKRAFEEIRWRKFNWIHFVQDEK